ncbi:MAG: hypothetical protein E7539_03210 [Ruminococcaceae bacterium]|nr:hypothetical protein [Oscillospiraceae bacterium]
MKKYYYCPHCGEKHIPWNEKFPRRYRGLMCNKVDKGISLRCHPLFWRIYLPAVVFCIIGCFVFLPIFRFLAQIFILLIIISILLIDFVVVFFSKFVKDDEYGKVTFDYKGTMEFAEDFKNPKLHFLRESVVILIVNDTRVPIRIEPIEIKERLGKFKFDCVRCEHKNKINTKLKNLKVLDENQTLGWMTLED